MPNDGFLANAVVPVGAGADALDGSEDDDDDDDGEGRGCGGEEEEGGKNNQGGGGSVEGSARRAAGAEGGTSARAAAAAMGGLVLGGKAAASPEEEEGASSSPEDMDALLEITLLQVMRGGRGGRGRKGKGSADTAAGEGRMTQSIAIACILRAWLPCSAASGSRKDAAVAARTSPIHKLPRFMLTQALSRTVKDSDLPLAGSGLWAQHLLPCRPVGSMLGELRGRGQRALMGAHLLPCRPVGSTLGEWRGRGWGPRGAYAGWKGGRGELAGGQLPFGPSGSSSFPHPLIPSDIKKSKHKKMSKLLQAYAGKGGLLSLKVTQSMAFLRCA